MSRYLRQQSLIDLLRNSLRIYRRDFILLFLASAPLDVPFSMAVNLSSASVTWTIAALFLSLCASSVSGGIMTVLVSDICVGNVPNLRRAYRHVFDRRFWSFFRTLLLANLVILAGLVLPLALFVLVPPVVILEGLTGRAALTRSRRLGKGYYFRSFALVIGIVVLGIWMEGPLHALIGRVLTPTGWISQIVTEFLVSAGTALVNVLGAIFVVLIYYDLRARKEAYDSLALAEDLRR